MTTIEGFDVSSHNSPLSIPWEKVKFGFIRASYGLTLDHAAVDHLTRARNKGVECLGLYHYLRGDRPGEEQAKIYFDQLCALEALAGVRLAMAVDVEDMPQPFPPWNRHQYGRTTEQFIQALRPLTDRPCAVYGSPGYLQSLNLDPDVMGPLWVAHWGVQKPQIPLGWADWTIHQYAVVENLDRNRFNGTEEQFKALLCPPLGYDTLGGVVSAANGAAGHGLGSVVDFADTHSREGVRTDE